MAKILYLEDEESLVRFLPPVLKEKGFEIASTMSIEIALEFFAQNDFDAVLLDIMMSPADNMDQEKLDYGRETGIEVARQMKKIKPKVPIIAFTVITDPALLEKIRDAGITKVLNKPAEIDQIVYVLEQIIGHKN